MKKYKRVLSLVLSAIILVSCFFQVSCGNGDGGSGDYKIVLHNMNGDADITVTKGDDGIYHIPADPVREGYTFIGWYRDSEMKCPFDYSVGITDDTELYAGWATDYAYLTNKITTQTMKSNVSVSVSYSGTTANGSGCVIYRDPSPQSDDVVCYALTNSHVVYEATKRHGFFQTVNVSVTDCKGNKSISAKVVACDPDYDLAIVRFTVRSTYEIAPITFSDSNGTALDSVIAIGTPLGQSNSITYGTLYGYTKIKLSDSDASSNVTFDVAYHDAPIASGSSGGMLLNTNLELIGINYASGEDEQQNFTYAYTIPIEKVREFLAVNKTVLPTGFII